MTANSEDGSNDQGAFAAESAGALSGQAMPCNFRQNSKLSEAQSRALKNVGVALAQSLATKLAVYLRAGVECAFMAAEQQSYGELLRQIHEPAYVAKIGAPAEGGSSLLQVDPGLVFPIIDLLLGGEGAPAGELRELTEVEDKVFEAVAGLICQELASMWQPLGVTFEFCTRQPVAELNKVMAPDERTLTLMFALSMAEVQGEMRVVFPGLLSNALIRKLAEEAQYEKRRAQGAEDHMRQVVLDCEFPFELSFEDLIVPAAQIVKLAPGQVLALGRKVHHSAAAIVAGVPLYPARPARAGSRRAAQITEEQKHAFKANEA